MAKSSIGMVQKELNEKYKVAGCEVINYEVKTMKKRLMSWDEIRAEYEAMFFSVWDDGTIIGSPCKVNVETKEVFDIKLVSDGIEGLGSLEREYIVLNDDEDEYQYPVFDSDPEDGNFWHN